MGRHFPSNCHHITRHGAGRLETVILGPSPGTGKISRSSSNALLINDRPVPGDILLGLTRW